MQKRLNVGVIFGGRSGEHEVSIVSADSVINALDPAKYSIIPIGIAKDGAWYAGAEAMSRLKEQINDPEARVTLPVDPLLQQLIPLGKGVGEVFERLDVIFPVVHGPLGEDGTLQGLLELTDLPYVGSGVLGSALSMDKVVQKHICRQMGLPVVDFLWIRDIDWQADSDADSLPILADQLGNITRQQMLQLCGDRLDFPLFVKPANMGSSVGISKAHNRQELEQAITNAFFYDKKILVEKAVRNTRELEVSVLGNDSPRASVIGEIAPSNEFYDYDAKYIDGSSQLTIPAEIDAELAQSMQIAAIKAFLAVSAESMARVDFLLDNLENRFYLSEVNTIPGFTSISMFPKLWEASGLAYSALLDELIRLAFERRHRVKRLQKSYHPKADWFRKNG